MKTTINGIRRYITLEFNETDLLELCSEINSIIPEIDSYNGTHRGRSKPIKMEKLIELLQVVNKSTIDILNPVEYPLNK